MRPCLSLLLLLGLALVPPVAVTADAPTSIRKTRFDTFCGEWMHKLQKREAHNLAKARPERLGGTWVLRYVGYERRHMRCEAKATRHALTPYVGKLAYHELPYERRASQREETRVAHARVVARTEILEIVRFNGSRWVY